jgi:2,3-bisphosphoglycerate-dependent phosphoglycerate mutase
LWASFLVGTGQLELRYLLFWFALGFFLLPTIEQAIIVTLFRRDLLKETLRSARIDQPEIHQMFAKLDRNGDGSYRAFSPSTGTVNPR